MKKLLSILFILSFLLSYEVHASNTSLTTDYETFSKSDEYETILALEESTLTYFKEILSTEGINFATSLNTLDYSNISKVYVDTGIETLKTDDKSSIKKMLADSNYVWVLPVEIGEHHFQITYARSGKFSTSTAWEVTEVALRPIVSYANTIKTVSQNKAYSDVVIIGGIPSFQMPVALAFDDSKAVSWIDLGYSEMYFQELLGEKEVKTNDGVYDYSLVIEAMNSEGHSLGFGSGGTSHSGIMIFIKYLPYIILFSGVSAVLSMLYIKRKSK